MTNNAIGDYEVDVEDRADLAKFYYNSETFYFCNAGSVDTKCPHCLKAFAVLEGRAPEDTCICVYKRKLKPYRSGFSMRNLTAKTYAKMFEPEGFEDGRRIR